LDLLKTELLNLFAQEEDKAAISLLLNWFKQLVVHGRHEAMDYEELEQVYQSQVEAKQMIETAIAKERQQIFEQGKAQGWIEGEATGKANLLIALLEMRFGPLSEAHKEQIYGLENVSLLKLSEKLWTAQSLSEILASDEER
jgi:flagellar biosynthesis/type III secretory pathway protein FliH